jgi:hypothetical protein
MAQPQAIHLRIVCRSTSVRLMPQATLGSIACVAALIKHTTSELHNPKNFVEFSNIH